MKKIRAFIVSSLLAVAALSISAAPSHALIYHLNTAWINGAAVYIGEVGTFTLTDNGNQVDIDIDLIGNDIKIQKAFLNFNASPLPNFQTTNGTGNNNMGVQEGLNTTGAPGYPGQFDLQIPDPPPGSVGVNHYTDSIFVTGMDLDPSMFAYMDTQNRFFVGVHISDNPFTTTREDSISVFDGSAPAVPEPGTMMLLGVGMLGLAVFGKRRMNKNS